MVTVKSYARKDRGKIIKVPSHSRKNRPNGKKKFTTEINYTATHIPRRNPPGVIKLKKPVKIKYKIKRYKKSGEFVK